MAQARHNESVVSFFTEQLCQEADLVYRCGFTMTLNRKDAAQVVLETYKGLLDELPTLVDQPASAIRRRLMAESWKRFSDGKRSGDVESSALAKMLNGLKLEARVALFMLDVAGLTMPEVAKICGKDEGEIRSLLAEARKAQVKFAAS